MEERFGSPNEVPKSMRSKPSRDPILPDLPTQPEKLVQTEPRRKLLPSPIPVARIKEQSEAGVHQPSPLRNAILLDNVMSTEIKETEYSQPDIRPASDGSSSPQTDSIADASIAIESLGLEADARINNGGTPNGVSDPDYSVSSGSSGTKSITSHADLIAPSLKGAGKAGIASHPQYWVLGVLAAAAVAATLRSFFMWRFKRNQKGKDTKGNVNANVRRLHMRDWKAEHTRAIWN
jgi:hypothetical protein